MSSRTYLTLLLCVPTVVAAPVPKPPEPAKTEYGLVVSLSIDRKEYSAEQAMKARITISVQKKQKLFNPFFDPEIGHPARILIRNKDGKVVHRLLDFRWGAPRNRLERDSIQVPPGGFVGATVTVYPARTWNIKDQLTPGEYTAEVIVLGEIFEWEAEKRETVVATSERVPFRIVK